MWSPNVPSSEGIYFRANALGQIKINHVKKIDDILCIDHSWNNEFVPATDLIDEPFYWYGPIPEVPKESINDMKEKAKMASGLEMVYS